MCLDLKKLEGKKIILKSNILSTAWFEESEIEWKNARKTCVMMMKKNFFQIWEENEEKIYSWSLVKRINRLT